MSASVLRPVTVASGLRVTVTWSAGQVHADGWADEMTPARLVHGVRNLGGALIDAPSPGGVEVVRRRGLTEEPHPKVTPVLPPTIDTAPRRPDASAAGAIVARGPFASFVAGALNATLPDPTHDVAPAWLVDDAAALTVVDAVPRAWIALKRAGAHPRQAAAAATVRLDDGRFQLDLAGTTAGVTAFALRATGAQAVAAGAFADMVARGWQAVSERARELDDTRWTESPPPHAKQLHLTEHALERVERAGVLADAAQNGVLVWYGHGKLTAVGDDEATVRRVIRRAARAAHAHAGSRQRRGKRRARKGPL